MTANARRESEDITFQNPLTSIRSPTKFNSKCVFSFWQTQHNVNTTDCPLCLCTGCTYAWRCRQSYARRKAALLLENIFGAADALPSASHHPVSQRLHPPGLRSQKCDFVRTLQPARCLRLRADICGISQLGNKKRARRSSFCVFQGFLRRLLDGTAEHRLRCVR